MRRLLLRKEAAPAIAAALALLCQALLAVPVAGRMALERGQAPRSAASHVDAMGHAARGLHAGMAAKPDKPAQPSHSERDRQACPFCATAVLFGLETPGQTALTHFAVAETAVARLALVIPAQFDHSHLSRAPPPIL
jgi:hypothetical protein